MKLYLLLKLWGEHIYVDHHIGSLHIWPALGVMCLNTLQVVTELNSNKKTCFYDCWVPDC